MGGKFPHFWDKFDGVEREEKMRKAKRIEEKWKIGQRRRDEEREKKKREIVPAFRLSNLDGPRVKVDPRNDYAWVRKSGSFIKLQEVGNFPTWIIFSLKSI